MTEIFKKLLYLLPKSDRFKIPILFLMMVFAAFLELGGIGLIPAFVAVVAVPEKILELEIAKPFISYLNITTSIDLLLWGSAALVIMFSLKGAYSVFFAYIDSRFLFRRKHLISKRLMSAYMRAPYIFHLKNNSAELVRNLTGELNVITNNILQSILKIGKDGIMAVSILFFLLVWEPFVTLIVLLLSGFGSGTFILFTQKKMKEYGEEMLQHRGKKMKFVFEGFGGVKEARVLNREKEFIDQFNREDWKMTVLNIKTRFIQQIPKPVVDLTAIFGMTLISVLLVWQGRPMGLIIPTLTLFAVATVRLMPTIQNIGSMYTQLLYNLASLDPVYNDLKLLEENERKVTLDRKKSKIEFREAIEVKDLFYSYPESDELAINGISFKIPKGAAVGFVGESGAGKTTIIDLMLGLIPPQKGKILVDGTDVHENISGWQRNIGYIPQSIYLADDTLRRNVAFGLPDNEIDDENVWKAIESAQLSKLVATLPEGINTKVGEWGTRLSGGQRQRVGIARALYHNPEVLFMDEATAALDNVTEKQVSEAIESLMGEKTIIMIAHRLTTVMNCEKLFLMDQGKIIQQGSYNELIEKSSQFREMALEH